ncbi:MAG: hypothetical protein D6751_04100 [Deltaproteobacteria bacterium]|nr:MAG: hypothetical protein D6751_04100 [Deltaproteobacteria bacterium]
MSARQQDECPAANDKQHKDGNQGEPGPASTSSTDRYHGHMNIACLVLPALLFRLFQTVEDITHRGIYSN